MLHKSKLQLLLICGLILSMALFTACSSPKAVQANAAVVSSPSVGGSTSNASSEIAESSSSLQTSSLVSSSATQVSSAVTANSPASSTSHPTPSTSKPSSQAPVSTKPASTKPASKAPTPTSKPVSTAPASRPVSTAPVQTGVSAKYYGANYGCDDKSQYDYVLSHADVVGGSKYSKTYSYDTSHPDGFEEYYGVPYTEAWRQIVAIRSCFAATNGSAGDGSAYAYFTGSNRVCSDTAKALEAALHEAGYNARLALGTQNGVSHMWVQVYEGGWYNIDGHISTSLNAGYSLSSTGYNL